MKVPALIMAGGKGKRMGLPVEKPLLPFLGKPLLTGLRKQSRVPKRFPNFMW